MKTELSGSAGFDDASFKRDGDSGDRNVETSADGVVSAKRRSRFGPIQHVSRLEEESFHDWNRNALHGERLLSASALLEVLVRDVNGKRLGKVEDFMLDMTSGRIEYVVFSFGGLFGLGNKLCAVTPNMLAVDEQNGYIHLNYDKTQVGNAPEFDKYKWPYMRWLARSSRIYVLRGQHHRFLSNANED